jgi:hypothetical protein
VSLTDGIKVSKDSRQECSSGVTGLSGGQAYKVTLGFSIKVRQKSCSLEGDRLRRQWWDKRSVSWWGDRTVVGFPKVSLEAF